jgi:DNA topoisomerase II
MMMNKENNNILTSPSSNYKKLSQREHVLARPDTYVGSVEFRTNEMWIYDAESKQLKSKEITYVPALYKIFDEILVNAADNKQRDPTMSWIKVDIDVENGLISVANNGKGIPVAMHSKEKMYIPELIFGNLLTSDNYDDKKNNKRTTGGRNGFGAKLTNIFSKSFTVETVDSSRNKKYVQTWNDNMLKRNDPKIKACGKGKKDYTKIIFKPDLAKFGMTSLDKDTVSLFTKRVYVLSYLLCLFLLLRVTTTISTTIGTTWLV